MAGVVVKIFVLEKDNHNTIREKKEHGKERRTQS